METEAMNAARAAVQAALDENATGGARLDVSNKLREALALLAQPPTETPAEWDARSAAFQSGFMAARNDPSDMVGAITRYLVEAGCPQELLAPEDRDPWAGARRLALRTARETRSRRRVGITQLEAALAETTRKQNENAYAAVVLAEERNKLAAERDAALARAETLETQARDISLLLSDAGAPSGTLREGVIWLREQRDDANEASEDSDGVRERLGDLLERIAIAFKGPQPPLTLWDWSDLPDRATKAVADLEAARAALRATVRFVEDDASAVSYQTLGQYRTMLLTLLRKATPQ